MTNEIRPTYEDNASNNVFNALDYMVETKIKKRINTAIPVRVDTVEPGGVGNTGYVSATPLITQVSGEGKIIEPVSIPKLPYVRVQGGKAAVIIDPIPGDIGIAIFAQQDISSVEPTKTTTTKPASFRSFDMSDGMYIGGILNGTPEVYIELTQDGVVNVKAPTRVSIESPEIIVTSDTMHIEVSGETTITSPTITCTGSIAVDGELTVSGQITSGSIALTTHVHGGVQPGSGDTAPPKG